MKNRMIKLLNIVAVSILLLSSVKTAAQDKSSIVVDNLDRNNVKISGVWNSSSYTKGFVGENYLTDNNKDKQHKQVKFSPAMSEAGNYNIYLQWTSGRNRAKKYRLKLLMPRARASFMSIRLKTVVNGYF